MVSSRVAAEPDGIPHEGEVLSRCGGLSDFGFHIAFGAEHPELHVRQPPGKVEDDADALLAEQSTDEQTGGRRRGPPKPSAGLCLAARPKYIEIDPVPIDDDPGWVQADRQKLLPRGLAHGQHLVHAPQQQTHGACEQRAPPQAVDRMHADDNRLSRAGPAHSHRAATAAANPWAWMASKSAFSDDCDVG